MLWSEIDENILHNADNLPLPFALNTESIENKTQFWLAMNLARYKNNGFSLLTSLL